MIAAVAEVDGLTDDEPGDQAKPGIKGEAGHQQQRNGDACQRNEGNGRCSERPLEIRTLMSQNPNARANNNECEQCADADEVAQDGDRQQARKSCDKQSDDNRGNPGRSESGMNYSDPGGSRPSLDITKKMRD